MLTPKVEIERRVRKLQKVMQKDKIGGALLVQRADLFYFSGTGQNAHLFIPDRGEPILIVKKSMSRAEQESSIEKIVPFEGSDNLKSHITEVLPEGSKIGVETDVLPVKLYRRYQKILKGYELTDISSAIRKIRAVKSNYEIGLLREAAKISTAVLNRAGSIIRECMTEVELAGQLEQYARTMGHQGAVRMRGFNQELYYGHIMSGENAATISFFDGPTGGSGLNPSFPQGAGLGVIKLNEPILVDFVSVLGGYMVDQTRIFCLGKPPAHLTEAYKTAVYIKNSILTMGKAGITASALYEKAEQIAFDSGLANHFMGYVEKVSFVGHGVGLELDELPVIARGMDTALEEGMVFALEPKFVFPGEGTVGIEDTLIVESEQLIELTSFSNELQVI